MRNEHQSVCENLQNLTLQATTTLEQLSAAAQISNFEYQQVNYSLQKMRQANMEMRQNKIKPSNHDRLPQNEQTLSEVQNFYASVNHRLNLAYNN
jgi:hypothetical protein